MALVKSYRLTVPDAVNSITVPNLGNPQVEKMCIIRNVGSGLFANTIRFNFEGDGASNYIELAPNTAYPVAFGGLRGGDIIYTDGVGGSGVIDVIIWEPTS